MPVDGDCPLAELNATNKPEAARRELERCKEIPIDDRVMENYYRGTRLHQPLDGF
jgi:hypothetical protein